MKPFILTTAYLVAFNTLPVLAHNHNAAALAATQPASEVSQAAEIDAVQRVVQAGYIDGFANLVNVPAMKTSFHPSFEMLWLKDDKVEKTPVASWISGAERRLAKANGTPPAATYTAKFLQVDVTGSVAVAKVAVYAAGTLAYTDYLSLYKFADGWRMVSKVGHSH